MSARRRRFYLPAAILQIVLGLASLLQSDPDLARLGRPQWPVPVCFFLFGGICLLAPRRSHIAIGDNWVEATEVFSRKRLRLDEVTLRVHTPNGLLLGAPERKLAINVGDYEVSSEVQEWLLEMTKDARTGTVTR